MKDGHNHIPEKIAEILEECWEENTGGLDPRTGDIQGGRAFESEEDFARFFGLYLHRRMGAIPLEECAGYAMTWLNTMTIAINKRRFLQ